MFRSTALALVVVIPLALSGCASSSLNKEAERAERAGRYDQAVALYTQLLAEKPDDTRLQQNLQRAKLRASASHALEAARRSSAGDLLGAKTELEVALTLNPSEAALATQIEELEALIAEKGVEAERSSI